MKPSQIIRIRDSIRQGTLVYCRQQQAIGGSLRATIDVVGKRHPTDGYLMWSERLSSLPAYMRREIADMRREIAEAGADD